MADRNAVKTTKIQLSLDEVTAALLQQMTRVGIFGKNRPEVASWIIREWVWHHPVELERLGIFVRSATLVAVPHTENGDTPHEKSTRDVRNL